MDDSLLKLEVENLRELLRLKDLNNDLLESNFFLMNRMIQEYRKEGRAPPVEFEALLGRVRQILREIQSKSRLSNRQVTQRRTTEDETEPEIDSS